MNPAPATIRFEVGVPQVLALAYPNGRPCSSRYSGDQLMFTCTSGDRFYVEPYVQERLKAAGVQVGVPFELEKVEIHSGNRRTVEFQVRQIRATAPTHNLPPAPPPPAQPRQAVAPVSHPQSTTPAAPVNGQGETAAAIMARCYRDAIIVAANAVLCAQEHGLRITPEFADVRAMAATLVITETGGRR